MLSLTLLAFGAFTVVGGYPGPTYPAPTDLTSNESLVRAAWEDAIETLNAYTRDDSENNTSSTIPTVLNGVSNVTFSAGLLSLHDDAATTLQYHYTAPSIATSPNGTNKVDGDSIYRAASITKLMTAYAGMVGIEEKQWNEPISKWLPELVTDQTNPYSANWDEITLWALASHVAGLETIGVIADTLFLFYLTAAAENTTAAELAMASGLRPLDSSLLGPCILNCTIEETLAAHRSRGAVFEPYTTVGYSNFGYMLLGQAISRITKKPYSTMYKDLFFEKLGMDSSFADPPLSGPLFDRSVIAGPIQGSWVYPDSQFSLPSGGLLSTIHDLDKFGLGILNSTLLRKETTRKWMKPDSHAASLSYSIGAPWEIIRYVNKATNKITDIYSKLGDSGSYGGAVILIPDYGMGFISLNALYEDPTVPPIRGDIDRALMDIIVDSIVPALEAQAAAEAAKNYVGTYTFSDANNNSTLIVTFNETNNIEEPQGGLTIDTWTLNGVDQLNGDKPRLVLSIPKEETGAGVVQFQSSTYSQFLSYDAAKVGPVSGIYKANMAFFAYDRRRYAGASLSTWRFDVDDRGRAVGVSNAGARLPMVRE